MASSTDLKINVIADAKKVLKELEAVKKQARKNYKERRKNDVSYQRTRKQTLAAEKRVAADHHKIQKKFVSDLQKAEKKGWDNKKAFRKAEQRAIRSERREDRKYRREAARANRSGPTMGGIRGAGRAVGGALGMVGGFVIGGAVSAYQKHLQVEKARAQMLGQGAGRARLSGKGFGQGLGFNYAETAQHQFSAARSTGVNAGRELQQLMRSRAVNAGEASSLMSSLAQSGTSFDSSTIGKGGQTAGGRAMARMMGASVYSGLKQARFVEFMKGANALQKAGGSMMAGDVGLGGSTVLSMLGKTNLSGFQGERGAAMAMKMNQAMVNPKSEHSRGRLQRAMGYGPGGRTSWWEAEKQMEKGLSDPKNLLKYLDQVIQEEGGNVAQYASVAAEMGIGKSQAQSMVEGRKAGKFNISEAQEQADKHKSLSKTAAENMLDNTTAIQHLAKIFNRFSTAGGGDVAKLMRQLQDAQLKAFETLLPPMVAGLEEGIKLAMDATSVARDLLTLKDASISYFTGENETVDDIQQQREAIARNVESFTSPTERAAQLVSLAEKYREEIVAKSAGHVGYKYQVAGLEKERERILTRAQVAKTAVSFQNSAKGLGVTSEDMMYSKGADGGQFFMDMNTNKNRLAALRNTEARVMRSSRSGSGQVPEALLAAIANLENSISELSSAIPPNSAPVKAPSFKATPVGRVTR